MMMQPNGASPGPGPWVAAKSERVWLGSGEPVAAQSPRQQSSRTGLNPPCSICTVPIAVTPSRPRRVPSPAPEQPDLSWLTASRFEEAGEYAVQRMCERLGFSDDFRVTHDRDT